MVDGNATSQTISAGSSTASVPTAGQIVGDPRISDGGHSGSTEGGSQAPRGNPTTDSITGLNRASSVSAYRRVVPDGAVLQGSRHSTEEAEEEDSTTDGKATVLISTTISGDGAVTDDRDPVERSASLEGEESASVRIVRPIRFGNLTHRQRHAVAGATDRVVVEDSRVTNHHGGSGVARDEGRQQRAAGNASAKGVAVVEWADCVAPTNGPVIAEMTVREGHLRSIEQSTPQGDTGKLTSATFSRFGHVPGKSGVPDGSRVEVHQSTAEGIPREHRLLKNELIVATICVVRTDDSVLRKRAESEAQISVVGKTSAEGSARKLRSDVPHDHRLGITNGSVAMKKHVPRGQIPFVVDPTSDTDGAVAHEGITRYFRSRKLRREA